MNSHYYLRQEQERCQSYLSVRYHHSQLSNHHHGTLLQLLHLLLSLPGLLMQHSQLLLVSPTSKRYQVKKICLLREACQKKKQ